MPAITPTLTASPSRLEGNTIATATNVASQTEQGLRKTASGNIAVKSIDKKTAGTTTTTLGVNKPTDKIGNTTATRVNSFFETLERVDQLDISGQSPEEFFTDPVSGHPTTDADALPQLSLDETENLITHMLSLASKNTTTRETPEKPDTNYTIETADELDTQDAQLLGKAASIEAHKSDVFTYNPVFSTQNNERNNNTNTYPITNSVNPEALKQPNISVLPQAASLLQDNQTSETVRSQNISLLRQATPVMQGNQSSENVDLQQASLNTLSETPGTIKFFGFSEANTAPIITPSTDVPKSPEATLSEPVYKTLKLSPDSARWGEQMMATLRQHITTQVNSQQQQTTIRLDPPELGAMEIFLQHDNGKITIQISATQSDIARILQQTSDRLRNELTQQAFVEVNVNIQQGQPHSGRDQQQQSKESIAENNLPLNNLSSFKSSNNRNSDVLVTV